MNAKLYCTIVAVITTTAVIISGMLAYEAEALLIPWPADYPHDNLVKCLEGVEYIHVGADYAIEKWADLSVYDPVTGSWSEGDNSLLHLEVVTAVEHAEAEIVREEASQCLYIYRAEILQAEAELRQQSEATP